MCLSVARKNLLQKRSVCIDNTNLESKTRLTWTSLAKEMNIPIRAIVVDTPKDICLVLSTLRMLSPTTAVEDRRKIATVV
jgi:bifunctional polynucleotide phosphatase/kinase